MSWPLRDCPEIGGNSYPLPELVLSRGARRVAFLGGDDALVSLKGDMSYKELRVRDLKAGRERQLSVASSSAAPARGHCRTSQAAHLCHMSDSIVGS